MVWVYLTLAKTGLFFRMKRNGVELSTAKILEENLLQSVLHQTLGEEFTFQQDNNNTLTKKIVDVSE
jgi:hypothetical protein